MLALHSAQPLECLGLKLASGTAKGIEVLGHACRVSVHHSTLHAIVRSTPDPVVPCVKHACGQRCVCTRPGELIVAQQFPWRWSVYLDGLDAGEWKTTFDSVHRTTERILIRSKRGDRRLVTRLGPQWFGTKHEYVPKGRTLNTRVASHWPLPSSTERGVAEVRVSLDPC